MGSWVASRRSRSGCSVFVLFVGVLTERSRSIWPSVLAHGSWNGLVQSYFSSSGAVEDRVFTGAGICSVSSAGWGQWECSFSASCVVAVPYPNQDGLSPKEPTGYESPVMWLWFRTTPKRKVPAAAT
jgi:hypothetical protein